MKLIVALLLTFGTAAARGEAAPTAAEAALLEHYETAVREKVAEATQAARQRLDESYRQALAAAAKKAAAEEAPAAAEAWQREAKRFAESKTVPDADEPETAAGVAKLRGFFRAESARLATRVRGATVPPLQQSYVASLQERERELTRALKIDEALAVRARTEAFVAANNLPPTSAPTEPATPATLTLPPLPQLPGAGIVDELVVDGLIDGDSILHVQADKLWWESGRAARPGRWGKTEQPTYVNGVAWTPEWPDAARQGAGPSSTYAVSLGTVDLELELQGISSQRGASIVEKRTLPTGTMKGNEFLVNIPDPENGAKWYRFALRRKK